MSASHVNGVMEEPSSGNGTDPHAFAPPASSSLAEAASRRPEVAVGVAFAGGFLLALLLRKVRA